MLHMQRSLDQMNLQIHRVGGFKILGAILTAALSTPRRGGVGADQFVWGTLCGALLSVCHEEVFATLIGTWWFVRHDQYTTIVQSKPSQMVLNHPKWRRS
jgi:hypothetical protein